MRGETSRPSHPWLITNTEKSRVGTANVHWEVREGCRPQKAHQAPISHDSKHLQQPNEGEGVPS